jgi:formyltetrahydrofolate deformylase
MKRTATLLISCPDQKGIVARLSNFVFQHGGNIVDSDHHSDFSANRFLGRIEWEMDGFALSKVEPPAALAEVADPMGAAEGRPWQLHFNEDAPRISIWCSRQDHCLLDLLWRHRAGELRGEIPIILSNHADLETTAAHFGIPFMHIPVTQGSKVDAEARLLALLKEHRVDLVVLAKYMQVLSDDFLRAFPAVMNIHHSFLPAFAGAQPYHQAHARGVKVIGATAHYVTPELDAGPIIEQEITRVSHRDTVEDLIRKGRDLERIVLARAVRLHLQHRVLQYGNRTVVFE